MGGKHSRNKGKGFEQYIARDLRPIYGDDKIRRGWQSRQGSDEPDIVGVPGMSIECKRQKLCNMRAALRQAAAQAAKSGDVPVAICRDDPKKGFVPVESRTYVTIYYHDFLNLLRKLEQKDLNKL